MCCWYVMVCAVCACASSGAHCVCVTKAFGMTNKPHYITPGEAPSHTPAYTPGHTFRFGISVRRTVAAP